MAHTEIITSVFTDIVGFTEKTANQSRVQHRKMLDDHDLLLLPLVKVFGGRKIKSVGDGLLLAFRSPTDAVRCCMAMQDSLFAYNRDRSSDQALTIRAAINVGEVSVDRNDIFGESVNLASRLEGVTPEGEVYFTQAVFLAMNKTEVKCEPVGARQFKGLDDSVEIYRALTMDESSELPYGIDVPEIDTGLLSSLNMNASTVSGDRAWWRNPLVIGVGGILIIVITILFVSQSGSPEDVVQLKEDAREALASNNLQVAEELVKIHMEIHPADPDGLLLAGHVQIAGKNIQAGLENYEAAFKLKPELVEDMELRTRIIDNIGRAVAINNFIARWPQLELVETLLEMAQTPGWKKRHAAVDILTKLDKLKDIDFVAVALLDLSEQRECEKRHATVRKLIKFDDKRAVEKLENLSKLSVSRKAENKCFRKEVNEYFSSGKSDAKNITSDTSSVEKPKNTVRSLVRKLINAGDGKNSSTDSGDSEAARK